MPSHNHDRQTVRRTEKARKILYPVQRMIRAETAGAAFLALAAVCALFLANSPLAPFYHGILHAPAGLRVGDFSLEKSLHHWVNDGLMALFFFVVGLELKREILTGALSGIRRAALPAIAALGGMVVPALFYHFFNPDGIAARGWAIPMATDIAFAIGALAFLGRHVPKALLTFLIALAIADDLGAILVIAFFYTDALSYPALAAAAGCVAVLALFNLAGVRRILPYFIVAALLWLAVLYSGVHATLAGVIGAFCVPLSMGQQLEKIWHTPVTFFVLPVFALFNAGVTLHVSDLFADGGARIMAGVFCGLVFGKLLGIAGACWLALRAGIARLPDNTRFTHIVGVAFLGGIGFTMSIFVSQLAFAGHDAFLTAAKAGILAASLVACLSGCIWLWVAGRGANNKGV